MLKNGYDNHEERKSFSVEIIKCKPTEKIKVCKNEDTVGVLLKNVYFDMHVLQQQLDLEKELSDVISPLKTLESMHSQFQLKYNAYIDNNNSLLLNRIKVDSHRFNSYNPTVTYDYFLLKNNYIWESDYQLILKDRQVLKDGTDQYEA